MCVCVCVYASSYRKATIFGIKQKMIVITRMLACSLPSDFSSLRVSVFSSFTKIITNHSANLRDLLLFLPTPTFKKA